MKGIKLLFLVILVSVWARAQHWAALPFQFDSRVAACIPDSASDSMFIHGSFTQVNGVPADVVKWDGNTGISYLNLLSWCSGCIDDIATYHGKMFVAAGYLYRKDDTGLYSTNDAHWDQADRFFRLGDRLAVMMDHLDYPTNTHSYHLSIWDGAVWKDTLRTDTVFYKFPFLSSIAYYQGSLYLATSTGIIRFDGNKWANAGGGTNTGGAGYIAKLYIWHGDLYACGSFFESENAPGNDIARWDGTSWHRLGEGLLSGYGKGAADMTVFNDELYVVGNFSQAGGLPADGIAKWDGQKWCAVNDDFGGETDGIVAFKGSMYVNSGWSTINGRYYNYMAKWVGGMFGDTCLQPLSVIHSLPTPDALLYPNPASDRVFISANDVASIAIVDATGAVVLNTLNDRRGIDVSRLAEGMYFVRIIEYDSVKTMKLLLYR